MEAIRSCLSSKTARYTLPSPCIGARPRLNHEVPPSPHVSSLGLVTYSGMYQLLPYVSNDTERFQDEASPRIRGPSRGSNDPLTLRHRLQPPRGPPQGAPAVSHHRLWGICIRRPYLAGNFQTLGQMVCSQCLPGPAPPTRVRPLMTPVESLLYTVGSATSGPSCIPGGLRFFGTLFPRPHCRKDEVS